MYDLLLTNARVFFPLGYSRPLMDIAIFNGKIVEVGCALNAVEAIKTLDVRGNVVMPGFVDVHLHGDTAYTAADGSAHAQIQAYKSEYATLRRRYKDKGRDEIAEDMYQRTVRLLSNCAAKGTTAAKLQISFDSPWSRSAMDAYRAAKAEVRHYMDVRCTVPYMPSMDAEWRKLAMQGQIDFIGGHPCLMRQGGEIGYAEDVEAQAERLIQLSREYGLPLDLHMDESPQDPLRGIRYIANRALEKKDFRLYGRVTLSHISALNVPGLSENEALDAVNRCAKANIHITELTSQNMVTMGAPYWRGVTRLHALFDAGANITLATGNIRDELHPFGNGDLLEEALTTAQAHKLGTRMELCRLLELITFNSAKAMLLTDYGALPGCNADLVVLEGISPEEVLRSRAKRLYVIKNGKFVAQNGELLPPEMR